jgi:hypothetical protein
MTRTICIIDTRTCPFWEKVKHVKRGMISSPWSTLRKTGSESATRGNGCTGSCSGLLISGGGCNWSLPQVEKVTSAVPPAASKMYTWGLQKLPSGWSLTLDLYSPSLSELSDIDFKSKGYAILLLIWNQITSSRDCVTDCWSDWMFLIKIAVGLKSCRGFVACEETEKHPTPST